MLRLAFVCVLLFSSSVRGGALDDFVAAEQALDRGDLETFDRLSHRLRDHPLRPYLRFAELTRDLNGASDARIEGFLEAYPGSQLAVRLRRAYLSRLAHAGRWADYARVYRPDDSVERQCLYLRALMETGEGERAMTKVADIWRSGHSRPSVCDPVFSAWRDAGGLTPGLTWERIRLAMEAGNLGLARHLGPLLPAGERPWYERWMALARDPKGRLEDGDFDRPHPMRAAMLADAIVRLARTDPAQAADALRRYAKALGTDARASDRAHAAVGAGLTSADEPAGLQVWDRMSTTAGNLPAQERRVRAALAMRAWSWASRWIERMPDGMQKRDRWLYWQARAEEQLGRVGRARTLYEEAANQRSFWGFMAADRIDHPYTLTHRPIPAAPERIRAIVTSPAVQRMRALQRLGRETDVRREWRALTSGMDTEDLMAAAYVADAFRWHDQAVFTQARSGYWDDLELRFPLAYQDLILDQAWQIGIDPSWILAVLRQESVFARSVASRAGAIGLMQLMPATAASVALELGLPEPSRWGLVDPELNIALGGAYLAEMRDRFGHAALATAAYNAGPRAVSRWLPTECQSADLWILGIPYRETRDYVERVMAYRVIYATRLGRKDVRLSDWVRSVPSGQTQARARVAGRKTGDS